MGRINMGRVILGGLLAGLIINIVEGLLNAVILEKDWTAVRAALSHPDPVSVKQVIAFNVWGFTVGVLLVWLYAAIRPRYGAGPRTALCAGAAVWMLAFALAQAVPVFLHLFPVGLSVETVAAELVAVLIAAVAGAAVYKEDGAEAPKAVGHAA